MSNLSPQRPEIVGAEGTAPPQQGTDKVALTTAVGNGLANILGAVFGTKAQPGQPATMPAWVMPVAIGGIAIVGISLFAGRKRG